MVFKQAGTCMIKEVPPLSPWHLPGDLVREILTQTRVWLLLDVYKGRELATASWKRAPWALCPLSQQEWLQAEGQ